MSINDYARVLVVRWRLILGVLTASICVACGFFYLQPKSYTAALQLYVSAPSALTPEVYYSSAQLAQERVESFGELATSPRVMAQTIAELRLNLTVPELQQKVSASTSEKTVLISLSATDSSPQTAAEIANSVASGLSQTVTELERPQPGSASAPLVVRAVQQAPVPSEPSSISLKRLLALSVLAGLVVGVGAALLRNSLDNTLATGEELAGQLDAPNLGEINTAGANEQAPMQQMTPFAEDLRRLRTNLQFIDAGSPHKVFALVSALSAEGKTTTVINLAEASASAGNRVLVVDADLRRPRVAQKLGADGEVGLTSVLARRLALREAIQPSSARQFDLLASGPVPPNPSELLASAQMKDLLGQLRQSYDLVLIDTSPLLPVSDAAGVASFTDGVLLLCKSRSTTRQQVRGVLTSLKSVNVPIRGTILTMTSGGRNGFMRYGAYSDTRFGKPLTGTEGVGHQQESKADESSTTLVSPLSPTNAEVRKPSPHPQGPRDGRGYGRMRL